MNIKNKSLITTVAFMGLMGGCATVAPNQLVEARAAYLVSSNGLAAAMAPTDLYDAQKSLDKANQEFTEHGDTNECRDYAYIAYRKIELADAKAQTEMDRQKIAEAAKMGVVIRDAQVQDARASLASTRAQLKEERRDNRAATNELRAANDATNKDLERSAEQLETERQARLSAEGKLAGAMTDLAAIAAVKQEARGMVITLSGSVLFVSGKYVLLNTAMTKLDQVAEALKAQDSDKRMVVEGHTDSRGPDSFNQPLSLNRANAVRDYLISRGVEADKITAVGMGSSKPITDNKTTENRANNRRVEIVIGVARLTAR